MHELDPLFHPTMRNVHRDNLSRGMTHVPPFGARQYRYYDHRPRHAYKRMHWSIVLILACSFVLVLYTISSSPTIEQETVAKQQSDLRRRYAPNGQGVNLDKDASGTAAIGQMVKGLSEEQIKRVSLDRPSLVRIQLPITSSASEAEGVSEDDSRLTILRPLVHEKVSEQPKGMSQYAPPLYESSATSSNSVDAVDTADGQSNATLTSSENSSVTMEESSITATSAENESSASRKRFLLETSTDEGEAGNSQTSSRISMLGLSLAGVVAFFAFAASVAILRARQSKQDRFEWVISSVGTLSWEDEFGTVDERDRLYGITYAQNELDIGYGSFVAYHSPPLTKNPIMTLSEASSGWTGDCFDKFDV